MSKQRIIDIIAIAIVLFFLMIIYVLPSAKDEALKVFCSPEIPKAAGPVICANGLFIMYLIPFFLSSWLILRVFVKITKFASIVDLNSKLCKGIGTLYEKMKTLDG